MFPSDLSSLLPLALSFAPFSALWGPSAVSPTVRLDQATVYGTTNGPVTSYLNIPFAEPPYAIVLAIVTEPRPESEDCLNLNVLVPAGTAADAKLPVIVFIYGGGFSVGENTQYNGEVMVRRSVEMGQPIIYTAVNYRLHAFGFLGGQEVKEAGIGNIGLHDQREGLRWIKKYIGAFGGDPNKVTIWGPSAGGLSVGSHLVANDGDNEGLFRGAVLSCGTLLPTGDISDQQRFFDGIAADTGCATATDKLACLRIVPAENLTASAASIPNILDYPGLSASQWFPHADGSFLKEPVREAVLAGRIADVPFIAGGSLDEGTIFATGAWNITTDAEFLEYMRDLYFPGSSSEEVAPLLALYPNDPAQGSPFGTGEENQLAPMYKRVSAFQGDFFFESQRRSLLTMRSDKQPAWMYLVQRGRSKGFGYSHGTDIQSIARGEELTDYLIQFVATLDPNGGSGSNRMIPWPRYDPAARQMLVVLDGEERLAVERDDAREEALEFLAALSLKYPL
ncbi:hypothetical protein GSI_13345 [Ganoderma sinense ZZ0214-1]|uniref:Carboxylic ester hydrolase n=1 Tax=Ganoderma sinense ZZ0214-1 TaxID=1077348 RepID=A0A2G8RVB3_9APHY|nr:hypothetical protein GSI_13345 [Ganoderma sinense ZZ0214-1]